ncbi:hypothetical protein AAF712_013700 [Marasmius tenuissimus]|uniref:Epoxide hydrolase N-terminal domain-containing protein n=1 Tax=Marasmius tenuissimus TaxID=585030 RepID=A0ABR2ZE68_9AGAR
MTTPFKINISDKELALLKDKLKLARFPDELEGAGWDYGAPLLDIRRLTSRWIDGYDWRKHEKALNDELPQFTSDIQIDGHGTLNIHFVHKQSGAKNAIPLLFIHGWPGSFLEVRKLLPLLTAVKEGAPSFHVVAYSLPGFGFSEGAKKKGFDLNKYAEVGHKLMLALGYHEYVVQGGDYGSAICELLNVHYGGPHVKALHTNMPMLSLTGPPPGIDPSTYTSEDVEVLERKKKWLEKGMGYFHQQATQPQTIGYSLTDSPVGLLAWICEKLVNWTDEYPWDDDEVLTWVSIYWFSRAGPTASARIYYETYGGRAVFKFPPFPPSKIPVGYSVFVKETATVPKPWLDAQDPVLHERHQRGGHFAAYEKPVELVDDLRKMFTKGSPAYGVVPGKDGYAHVVSQIPL